MATLNAFLFVGVVGIWEGENLVLVAGDLVECMSGFGYGKLLAFHFGVKVSG